MTVVGKRTGGKQRRVEAPTYSAFISYSHALDGQLAPALQAALHRFAKPWYRVRALRVFRDEASLSANPALWSSIEQALSASEFFVLLASPEAAASVWVDREVSWWRAHKDPSKLLIAVTAGEIAWDGAAGDFDWARTSCLPPSLRGALSEEPRHIDLRWAREADQLSLTNPRFRDCVADVAAPMHGRPKDELFGEDVRQHRRTVRLARSAIAVMAVLTVAASTGAVVAVDQRDKARTHARLATSRQLAATSRSLLDTQFDLAMLLALEGLRAQDTPQARSSLFSALERNPQHVAFLRGHQRTATALEFTGDGRSIVSGDAGGTLIVWNVDRRGVVREIRSSTAAGIESLGVSADGRLVASGARDGTVTIWEIATGHADRTLRTGEQGVGAVAFSRDGALLATGDALGNVVVWNVASGAEVVRLRHGGTMPSATSSQSVTRLSFSDDGQRLDVGGSFATASSWNVRTKENLRPFISHGFGPRDTSVSAFSPAGGLVAWGSRNGIGVVPPGRDYFDSPRAEVPGTPDSMAFDPDGRTLAVGGQSAVRLLDAASLEPLAGVPVLTGYPGRVAAIAIDRETHMIAVAAGDSIVLSDLGRSHRVGRVVSEPHTVANALLGDRSVSFSPDGRVVAWLDPQGPGSRPEVRVWDVAKQELRRFSVEDGGRIMSFASDGQALVVIGRGVPVNWSLDGRRLGRREKGPAGDSYLSFQSNLSFTSGGRGYVWYTDFGFQKDSQLVLRDVDTAETVFSGAGTEGRLVAAISRGGTLALGITGGSIALWDVAGRRQIDTLLPVEGGSAAVDSLAYSGDGRVLASLSAGTIAIWDVESRVPRFTLRLGGTGSLALSADGSLLAAGTEDGTMTLWDVGSRQLLGTLRGAVPEGAFPVEVAFAPDGNTMASAIHGGGMMLWDLRLSSWRELACSVARRDLSDDERRLHVGSAVSKRRLCPPVP